MLVVYRLGALLMLLALLAGCHERPPDWMNLASAHINHRALCKGLSSSPGC